MTSTRARHKRPRSSPCWQRLDAIAREGALGVRAHAQLAKTKRLSNALLATLAFFFATISASRR